MFKLKGFLPLTDEQYKEFKTLADGYNAGAVQRNAVDKFFYQHVVSKENPLMLEEYGDLRIGCIYWRNVAVFPKPEVAV